MQNSSSDLLINSKYAIVSIDIYFRIGAQPGTDAPPNYIGRHIVLDREAESIKIDNPSKIRSNFYEKSWKLLFCLCEKNPSQQTEIF